MADNIVINANTNPAIASLGRLITKLEEVESKFSNTFDKLNNAAVGLGATLIGLATATAAFADGLVDVADANQLALGEVLALGTALQESGGKMAGLGSVLQKLSQSVDDANGGNEKLIKNFEKMGISVSDLGSLSDTAIRDKLLDSLAKIEDPMTRNARATEFFGKSLAGVDIVKFAEQQRELREETERYAPSLQLASDAFGNIEAILLKVRLAFAEAFAPFFKIVAQLKVDVDALVVAFKALGVALGVLIGASAVRGVLALKNAFLLLNAVVSKNPLVMLGAAAGGLLATLGIIKGQAAATEELNTKTEQVAETTKKVSRDQSGLKDLYQKQADELDKQRQSLTKMNPILEDSFNAARKRYELELNSFNLNEQQRKQAEARAQIDREADAAKKTAMDAFSALNKDAQNKLRGDYDEQLQLIENSRQRRKAASDEEIANIMEIAAARRDAESSTGLVETYTRSLLERGIAAQKEVATVKERLFLEQRLIEISAVRSRLSKEIATLNEKDRQAAELALTGIINDGALVNSNYENFSSTLNDIILKYSQMAGVSQAGTAALTNSVKTTAETIQGAGETVAELNNTIAQSTRQFEFGFKKAFVAYVENATNAATKAENLFKKATQGMEDAFVNFAKTGKFEWKGFVASLAEELLRSQIQQLMANLFTGQYGGSGVGSGSTGSAIFAGLKSLMGFANGGIIPTNGPVIVGERGPEILSGASGRVVTPNNQLGGGSVTYNINAVDAMSFKQMIARDPSFIHAVASQGARTIPNRRA